LFITVIGIYNNLDVKDDLFFNVGESGHANLSIDRGVGIPAVVCWGWGISRGMVTVGRGMVGKSHQRQKTQDKGLIIEKIENELIIKLLQRSSVSR